MTVDSGSISEAAFLLTELRYTLGQLHVQVLDLDEETRRTAQCNGQSIEQMLSGLMASEGEYQQRYARLLGASVPQGSAGDEHIPLPMNESDETNTVESRFEHERARTIHLLEGAGEDWSEELLEAVREQVANDRQVATNIAECRKTYFEQPQRPDLEQPLTQTDSATAGA